MKGQETKKLGELLLYPGEDGRLNLEVRLEQDTVWLTLNQMAGLFQVDKSGISRHLRNIYESAELDKGATVANFATVQEEGRRRVARELEYYNLDAVISVGYRVRSGTATRFRQWATGVLKEHLTKGYTIHRQRFEENAKELEAALKLVQRVAKSPELEERTGRGLVELVTRYAQTLLLLQRYDEGLLTEPQTQPGGQLPSLEEARLSLANLKKDLIHRKEATALFAQERDNGLAAILGNLDQTAFGEPAYPSIESKAAHLLYFVIKNHPFADGNKRSGAFLFVDFLNRNGRLLDQTGSPVINDLGLAALALLVAESAPAQKETMIRLVMNMLVLCY